MTVVAKSASDDLLALADRLAPQFRRAFLDAVQQFRDSLSFSDLRDAASGHRVDFLQGSDAWELFVATLTAGLAAAVRLVVLRAGSDTLETLPASVAMQLRFDLGNPRALDAIDTIVQDVLQDIQHANITGIAQVLRVGFDTGATPEQSAVSIDIDVTRRLRVQGEVGADGRSAVGIGTEWEY